MSRRTDVRDAIRTAVADYMYSEGCSCCRNSEAHERHRNRLAKLLDVPSHIEDKSFYDFTQFSTYELQKKGSD